MTALLARRDLLAALVAMAATPALARTAGAPASAFDDLDSAAVERIGRAWLTAHPGANAKALAANLFPGGRGPTLLPALRGRVAEDFRRGDVFIHRGWRLSQTEGALFGLLALES